MGLDAVVYRNREQIELGPDDEHAKVDALTGEVHFDDVKLEKKFYHRREAVAHRLGNIAAIAQLEAEITRLIRPQSLIVQKILYSGTHTGDVITLKDLPELSAELLAIRRTNQGSPLLQEFVATMEELTKAANREGNPIVFV